MGKLKGVKKITTISILIALSVVFSYFDSLVSMGMLSIAPVLVAVFYEFRIGLANIVILIIILNFSFRDALLSAVLKSLLVGLFLWGGSVQKMVIGLGGTMLSFFVMELLYFLIKKRSKASIIFISMVGAVFHGFGQIIAVYLFYIDISIYALLFTYIPGYTLSGLVSGSFIGFIVYTANEYINKSSLGNYQKKSV